MLMEILAEQVFQREAHCCGVTDESKHLNYRTLFFHHFLITAPHPHTGRSAFTETDVLG